MASNERRPPHPSWCDASVPRKPLANTDSPTALWQLRRLVAAAQNDRRQVFASPTEVTQWLGEVLTAEERARLAQFLAGPDDGVRTGT